MPESARRLSLTGGIGDSSVTAVYLPAQIATPAGGPNHMTRISFRIVALLALLYSGGAFAQSQCNRPQNVAIPDGASASLDQMLEAQSGVRAYMTAMEEYLECINEVIEDADDETPPETVNGWIEQHNESVDEMEATAARFNEERIAYQQANPSD